MRLGTDPATPWQNAIKMAKTIELRLHRLRFEFEAKSSICFPPYKSTNILRGAFGTIFRRIACLPECREPTVCPLEGACAYEQVFAPIAREAGPSGFRDPPRPLVFRGSHLDGRTVSAGERFWFDVHLFRIHPETVAFLTLSFAQFAIEGIGPRRGRALLRRAETIGLEDDPAFCFFSDGVFRQASFPEPLVLRFAGPDGDKIGNRETAAGLRVQFRTPTELKQDGRVVELPEAQVLAARAFDRISALQHFYGEQPWAEETVREQRQSLLEAAGCLTVAKHNLTMVGAERLSSRTGQKHALEGFVGEVEYQGPGKVIPVLTPWLRAAAMAGVGRQTVWGKGEVRSGHLPRNGLERA